MTAGETHQAIEATFRIERARLIAGLARIVSTDTIAHPACNAIGMAPLLAVACEALLAEHTPSLAAP